MRKILENFFLKLSSSIKKSEILKVTWIVYENKVISAIVFKLPKANKCLLNKLLKFFKDFSEALYVNAYFYALCVNVNLVWSKFLSWTYLRLTAMFIIGTLAKIR